MDTIINKADQPVQPGLAQNTIPNSCSIEQSVSNARPEPMSAEQARDQGMNLVLRATPPEARAAIAKALLDGFDQIEPCRAEEALARTCFQWPPSAPPRCLGGIVSSLARLGLIVEAGWTKGRTGRSHAGRVSLWLRGEP